MKRDGKSRLGSCGGEGYRRQTVAGTRTRHGTVSVFRFSGERKGGEYRPFIPGAVINCKDA